MVRSVTPPTRCSLSVSNGINSIEEMFSAKGLMVLLNSTATLPSAFT